ncbi:hypothetical protein [Paenibacillus dauci]|uniref:hypothetical protein n=1 Tax=Paenibacillus dauci TaxID=1567106 RepID=UPI000619238D|nr:hypothetical protein [Paenibacillus dauci]
MLRFEKLNQQFVEFSEKIQDFIIYNSRLVYVKGSEEVVENGAYTWSLLQPDQQVIQSAICRKYETLMHPILTSTSESEHLSTLKESYERVVYILKQEEIVFTDNVADVLESIRIELKLQLYLCTQL